ncbi:hypothetical protein S40288_05971 [Stachybotrys chartarum IBT 40288]|nr:hypothetical protein S40288_05971 [Stachybotrys chartarum IBT 40288]
MSDLAQKVFQWVAVAKQPLTLDELREAVSIEIGQEFSRPERLVHGMNRIILWCENLIQVAEEGTQLVQFAHSTIRDFMVRGTLPRQLMAFHIDMKEADHFAGEICITYLHFNDFKTTIARRPQPLRVYPMAMAGTVLSQKSPSAGLMTRLSNLTFRHSKVREGPDLTGALGSYSRTNADRSLVLQQSHPFLKYAAVHWVYHTVRFREGKSTTWNLWHQIITEGHGLARIPWQNSTYQFNDAILHWSYQTHHYALLLYFNGFSTLPKSMKDEFMISSASQGENEAVIMFLETGTCSVNAIDRALQAASAGGHLQVVERLLIAGANVSPAAVYDGLKALLAASEGGHLQVVERLLIAGADIYATTCEGQTALQIASECGHLQIVERLLIAGADVNFIANGGQTALQAASEHGHLQIVERLLTVGADVNFIANEGRTALLAASEHGHLQIVERLLAAGADINFTAYRRTALQAASEHGHLQIVERLLIAGADINFIAFNGQTALQAASEHGHLQAVEQLLAKMKLKSSSLVATMKLGSSS